MLAPLGIDECSEAIYRALLAEPFLGVAALAERTGFTGELISEAVERLAATGLIRIDAESSGLWRSVAPSVCLVPLLERAQAALAVEQERLSVAQTVVAQLAMDNPVLDTRATSGQFRPLYGLDAVHACLEDLARSCVQECLTMLPSSRVETIAPTRVLDRQMFDRGVVGRILWPDAVKNDPEHVAYGQWLTRNGAPVRTLPTVPARMVVMDRRVAVIPLTDHLSPEDGCALVTAPGMIQSLVALFDQSWAVATPIEEPPRVDEATGLTESERDLLVLLGSGLTDAAVGKKLGVSERTVSRMVSNLMTRLDASSRFEAGLEAARRGWI